MLYACLYIFFDDNEVILIDFIHSKSKCGSVRVISSNPIKFSDIPVIYAFRIVCLKIRMFRKTRSLYTKKDPSVIDNCLNSYFVK